MHKNQPVQELSEAQKETLNLIENHKANQSTISVLSYIAKVRGVHYTTVRECVDFLIKKGHLTKIVKNGRVFLELAKVEEEQNNEECTLEQGEEAKSVPILSRVLSFLRA